MEVDLVCLGNHEFDFGEEVLEERIKESKFKWLNSNCFYRQQLFKGTYYTHKIDLKTSNPNKFFTVGFFGLCTADTKDMSFTSDETEFRPVVESAKLAIEKLRESDPQPDLIVAVTHLMLSEDRKLAKEVPQINVILGGHG